MYFEFMRWKVDISVIVLFVIISITTLVSSNLNWGKNHWRGIIESDGKGYYAYLPAIFIYKDLNEKEIKNIIDLCQEVFSLLVLTLQQQQLILRFSTLLTTLPGKKKSSMNLKLFSEVEDPPC